MTVRLVTATRAESGWKGTWYREGESYFVVQDPAWPRVVRERWLQADPDGPYGSIAEDACCVERGFLAWCACRWFHLTNLPTIRGLLRARKAMILTAHYAQERAKPWGRNESQ